MEIYVKNIFRKRYDLYDTFDNIEMSIASKLIIEWNLPFMKDYVPPFHTSTKYGKMWKFADLITSICISEIVVGFVLFDI